MFSVLFMDIANPLAHNILFVFSYTFVSLLYLCNNYAVTITV